MSEIKRRRDSKLPDKETLQKLYWDEMLTMKQIGEVYGSSASVVLYHLRKHGIEIRDRSDSSKVAYKNGRRSPTRNSGKRLVNTTLDGKIVCPYCKAPKDETEFQRIKWGKLKDSNSYSCNQCSEERTLARKLRPAMRKIGKAHCLKCKTWKPVAEFTLDGNASDGLSRECKRCASRNQEYYDYLIERETLLQFGQKYCPKCESVKTIEEFNIATNSTDGYQGVCKDCQEVLDKIYWAERGDELRQRIKNSKYWQRPHVKARSSKWKKINKERVNEGTRRRRARRRGNGGEYSDTQWKMLIEFYCPSGICPSCNRIAKLFTPDHVIPVSKGGVSFIYNIQPLCFSCNSSKGVKTTDYRPDAGAYAISLMEIA